MKIAGYTHPPNRPGHECEAAAFANYIPGPDGSQCTYCGQVGIKPVFVVKLDYEIERVQVTIKAPGCSDCGSTKHDRPGSVACDAHRWLEARRGQYRLIRDDGADGTTNLVLGGSLDQVKAAIEGEL
jgi:hypothetical protein